MSHLSRTVCNKYYRLKNDMLAAYNTYEAYPTEANRIAYNMLTQRWRDFCVETVAKYSGDDLLKEEYCE